RIDVPINDFEVCGRLAFEARNDGHFAFDYAFHGYSNLPRLDVFDSDIRRQTLRVDVERNQAHAGLDTGHIRGHGELRASHRLDYLARSFQINPCVER